MMQTELQSSEVNCFARYEELDTEKLRNAGFEVITLHTPRNDLGHTDDILTDPDVIVGYDSPKTRMPRTLSDDLQSFPADDTKSLPLALFKLTVYVVAPSSIIDKHEILRKTKQFSFPTVRLCLGFERVLQCLLTAEFSIDIHKPDMVSILTASLLLHCNEIVHLCVSAIDKDDVAERDFDRALKVAKKFHKSHSLLLDSLVCFALRHKDELLTQVDGDESLLTSFDRIRSKFSSLFNPVKPVAPPSITPTTETTKTESYGYLELFRVERFECADSERFFFLTKERTNETLCVARINKAQNGFWFFQSPAPQVATEEFLKGLRKYDLNYIGMVESNVLGDEWTIYDFGDKRHRNIQGQILYARNALGRIPNSMVVLLPTIKEPFETKKPKWSDRLGWSLDFKSRVSVASKKNFLLLDSRSQDTERIVMLFGKKRKHLFHLDLCEPISPLVGFSIAMTTFADKLIVT